MLNISFHYRALFSFRVLHEYYSDETLTDFLMVPTSYSNAKARSLGLIIKQIDNTLSVLFEEEKKELIATLPAEELTFSFFIYTKNLYFQNFTQLPIEAPEGRLLYFSNRNNNGELAPGALSKNEHVGEADYRNLSEINEPFPAEHPVRKPIAFVEIVVPELLRKEILEKEDFKSLSQPNYFIKFSARKTYWKYAFVTMYRKLENQAEILHSGGLPANFTRTGNETLLNKQEAVVFVSNEPLTLKQRSEYELKLTQKDKVSKATEIIPRLPVPSIEMIKPESRAEDAKIYSEVVVYI